MPAYPLPPRLVMGWRKRAQPPPAHAPGRTPGRKPRAHSCTGAEGRRPPTLFPESCTAHPHRPGTVLWASGNCGPQRGTYLDLILSTAAPRPDQRDWHLCQVPRGPRGCREERGHGQGGQSPGRMAAYPMRRLLLWGPNSEMGLEPLWPSQHLLRGLSELWRWGGVGVTSAVTLASHLQGSPPSQT